MGNKVIFCHEKIVPGNAFQSVCKIINVDSSGSATIGEDMIFVHGEVKHMRMAIVQQNAFVVCYDYNAGIYVENSNWNTKCDLITSSAGKLSSQDVLAAD